MDKINFQNLPSTTTPVNATNLNQMQTNVDNAKVEKTVTLANQNLNDVTTQTGFYFINQGTNRPEATNGYLLVQRYTDNYVSQEYITTSGVKYIRVLRNGTWSDWQHSTQPETITNTNGTAIKFADGTMICYGNVSYTGKLNTALTCGGYRTSAKTATFPVEFYSTPSVSIMDYSSLAICNGSKLGANSKTSANIIWWSINQNTTDQDFSAYFIAIGRWKA